MSIQYNRIKVNAAGVDENTNFTLGSPVHSFATFKSGPVRYTVITESGKWQVGNGSVSGITLTRGTVEENYLGTLDQIDFSGEDVQIAQTTTAKYFDDITDKLDTIEENATGDMTGAEIKALYETEDDTNAFTDAEQTKLGTIEENATADQTGAEIKSLYEAELDTNAYTDSEKSKLAGIPSNADADQIASEVPFIPTATIADTDVQAAIEQVDFVGRNYQHPATEVVYDPVDDPITAEVFVQEAVTEHGTKIVDREYSATGLLSGGKIYGSVSTTVFHIEAGEGIFVDSYTDPTVDNLPNKYTWSAVTDIDVSADIVGLVVANVSVFLKIVTGTVTVVKVVGSPATSYFKDHIYLGLVHTVDGTITGFSNAPRVAKQIGNDLTELMHREIEITGGDVNPVTGALSVWQSSGTLYFPGVNWHDTDHKNINKTSFAAIGSSIDPIPFNVITQLGVKAYTANTVIPVEYDNAGVVTALPATKATIHRLYSIGTDVAQRKYILLLGQNLYDSATLANDNLLNDNIETPDAVSGLLLIGYICVTAESTDFSSVTSAWIISSISSLISSESTVITWGNIVGNLPDQVDLNNRFNALEAPDVTVYNDMTGAEPSHLAGQLYYANGVLNFQNGSGDVSLQIGREQHVLVYNNTGVTITNGQAVAYAGVATGLPSVVPALADTFNNANGLGVATHDILTGSEGIVTSFGLVNGLNLSAFNDGDVVYLSDTVAGGLTTTPPDIASRIGLVFSNDAVAGKLFVNTEANISLPDIIGILQRTTNKIFSLTGTYQDIVDYTSEGSLLIPVDQTTGIITIPYAGFYDFNFTASGTFSTDKQQITFQIWDDTNSNQLWEHKIGLSSLQTLDSSVAISLQISLNIVLDNTDVVIRALSSTNGDMILNNMSFSARSAHIR